MKEQFTLDALTVKNFKGCTAFHLAANKRRIVLLRGPNGAGKSSILQAFATVLLGDKAAPVRTIQDGAKTATVLAELIGTSGGKLRIVHEWRRRNDGGEGHTLSVERIMDGKTMNVSKPQAALDELFDTLTLDPLQFYREKLTEKRVAMIQRAAGLDVADGTKLASEIESASRNRMAARAELERDTGRVATLAALRGKDPVQDIEAIGIEANVLWDTAQKQRAGNDTHSRAVAELNVLDTNAAVLQRELRALGLRIVDVQSRQVQVADRIRSMTTTDPLIIANAEIRSAQLRNTAVAASERAKTIAALADAETKAKAASKAAEVADLNLDALRNQRRAWIAEGLKRSGLKGIAEIDDDGQPLVYGKPALDASGSERILASARIAMATNPSIRVLLLDESDALGPDALTTIDGWATDNGFNVLLSGVWMQTEVADTIEIEDGEVRVV